MPALPAIPPSGENKWQGSYLTYSSQSLYATRRYLLASTRQHSSKNRKSLSQRSLWIAPICAREQSKALMPMTALQSHAWCFTPKIAAARPRRGSHSDAAALMKRSHWKRFWGRGLLGNVAKPCRFPRWLFPLFPSRSHCASIFAPRVPLFLSEVCKNKSASNNGARLLGMCSRGKKSL